MAVRFLILSLPAIGVFAQAQDSADPQPAPTPEHLEELQRCREGILDAEARPRVVRHHVEVLHASDDRVLIRGTLPSDAEIVVGNTERIAPGQAVAPTRDGA